MNSQQPDDRIKTDNPRISFLLRMWCVDETWCSNWRASLEMPETGQRIGFASLEQLFIYLIDLSESRLDVQDPGDEESIQAGRVGHGKRSLRKERK